ncbi:GTPase KRas-like [Antechinus flavipes]|uniref:GTPase KRas-like n=1 Tax=Antechinus flavipes TaxID=38775 RepID=UPI0022365D98|nr:GTPase KRas-like [Antechinus flavipes]
MAFCVHTSIGDPERRRTKMYKLVVMGTCSVGKTALIMQFAKDHFMTEYGPTIQDSYRKHTVVDEEQCHLDIMDTTSTEAFYCLRDESMHRGEGFLLVYAVNDLYSFDNVNILWNHLQGIKGNNRIPVVLVANKVDVTDRLVNHTMGQEVARSFGVPYVETSAKTGQGVEQAFHDLVREICRLRAEEELKSLPNTKQKKVWEFKFCTIQ